MDYNLLDYIKAEELRWRALFLQVYSLGEQQGMERAAGIALAAPKALDGDRIYRNGVRHAAEWITDAIRAEAGKEPEVGRGT